MLINLLLYLLSGSAALVAAIPAATQTLPPTLAIRKAESTAAPTGLFTTTDYVVVGGVTNDHVTIPGKTINIDRLTCIQTETPDENGYVPPGTCGAIFHYYPSFAAAVAFAILFAVLTGVHIWQAAMYKRTWCWVIIMASIWEMMAFLFRAISTKHQKSKGVYLVFQIFILLAPIWVNAFAYMSLGRMVYYFLPSRSIFRMPAATLAAVFVALDIISFVVQLVGGTMAGPGNPPELQQNAIHIYMGGIGLQQFFILVFVVLCIEFQRQNHRLDAPRGGGSMAFFTSDWGMMLCALYFSLAMISVRIIYRLIEFSGGMEQDNPLITHEVYFYALEAVPMFLALLVFNIVHPGRIMKGPYSDMPGLFSVIKYKISRRRGKKLLDDRSDSEVELQPGHPGWEMSRKGDQK